MLAIYRREVKSLFNSMLGFLFIAFYFLIFGIYFIKYNFSYGYAYLGITLSSCFWVYLLFAFLTMRSLPEERKEKIDIVLYTSPISINRIIIGKFLAFCSIWAIVCILLFICPFIISTFGNAYIFADILNIIAYFLLGCVLISICLFVSSLTENQVIAAIVSLVVIFFIGFSDVYLEFIPNTEVISLLGIIALCLVVGLCVYLITKTVNYGIICFLTLSIIALGVYILDSKLFKGLINNIIHKLGIVERYNYMVLNYTFDFKIILLYFSLIFIFIFFTIQGIHKRRYS